VCILLGLSVVYLAPVHGLLMIALGLWLTPPVRKRMYRVWKPPRLGITWSVPLWFLGILLFGITLPDASSLQVQSPQATDATLYSVTKVVDGDTLDVRTQSGTVQSVRIVGIDSPEIVDPRKPVQCFAKEASARLHALLDGKAVHLERNPGEDRDVYGRWLRYVDLDGTDVGAQMILGGFAASYNAFAHVRSASYNELQREARAAKRGMWGPACDPAA
jgi:micrococcal nuclease